MKKFSSIAVLTAFFVCGIALGAHARDVEKIVQQGSVSVEVSNETVSWHDFNILLVSAVPDFKAEKAELPDQCTASAKKTCGEGEESVTIIVEYTAESCSEAAAVVDGVMGKVDCVGFD